MSDSHDSSHGHEEMGFFRKYLWSTNHKTIGKQFLVTSLIFLFIAGSLALSLRWQLAFPGKPVPIIGKYLFATAAERHLAGKRDPLEEAVEKLAPAGSQEKIDTAFRTFDGEAVKDILSKVALPV